MVNGKSLRTSPIIHAVRLAEHESTAEIRVHISKKWIDPNPLRSATDLFFRLGLNKTSHKNGVLVYLNSRKKTFAIVFDEGVSSRLTPDYVKGISQHMHEDLQSTYFDNAVAIAVRTIGITLSRLFPRH
jgi:uncharacterized membrane protein